MPEERDVKTKKKKIYIYIYIYITILIAWMPFITLSIHPIFEHPTGLEAIYIYIWREKLGLIRKS
jgi:hypothetical protein